MGLSKLFSIEEGPSHYDTRGTLSRLKFKEILDEAITFSDLDNIHPSLANKIRSVGQTKTQIAYGEFQAIYTPTAQYCGCPMTEAGVVKFEPEPETIIDDRDLQRKIGAANMFIQRYDQSMARETESTIVEIVD